MSQQTGKHTLYAKIAAVMAEMSGISKDGVNRHFDYKFVTADAVADKVRQLLSARGVAFFAAIVGRELLPMQRTYTDKKTGEVLTAYSNRWVVDFEFTFADSDTGEYEVRKWSAEADAADDKGINKCATAAEKYFLLKTFIVSTGDEPDADADGARKRAQAPQNGRQAQRPPQPPPAQPSPVAGGNSRPLASDGSTPSSPSSAGASNSAPAGGKDDTFGKQFPPKREVMPSELWDAMHDFFDNEHHFREHWKKHASTYADKTLEEASAWLRNYHWNYDKDQCKRLVADAKANYGMDIDNVMEALSNGAGHSVKRMVQWDGGDWGAARAAITLWAEAHKQESAQP